MVKSEQVLEIISKGIMRFEKPYDEKAENIQLVFSINDKNQVNYVTCVNQAPRNTVTLKDLIGNNIYNVLVNTHIKKLLEKFAQQNNLPKSDINLMAGLNAQNEVYVNLRNKNTLIRVINDPDELRK